MDMFGGVLFCLPHQVKGIALEMDLTPAGTFRSLPSDFFFSLLSQIFYLFEREQSKGDSRRGEGQRQRGWEKQIPH